MAQGWRRRADLRSLAAFLPASSGSDLRNLGTLFGRECFGSGFAANQSPEPPLTLSGRDSARSFLNYGKSELREVLFRHERIYLTPQHSRNQFDNVSKSLDLNRALCSNSSPTTHSALV